VSGPLAVAGSSGSRVAICGVEEVVGVGVERVS